MTGTSDQAELHRRVVEAEERNLNLADALVGAEAAAAQARRDIDDIFHRLHARETELKELKELLGFGLDTPFEEIARALNGPKRSLLGAAKRSVRARPRR